MSNMIEWIIPVAFILVFLSFLSHLSSSKKVLNKLENHFNGAISRRSLFPIFKGQYQGLDFYVRLDPAGKNTPPYLTVFLSKECSATLKIYQETELSVLGKKIGLVREIKINDEIFDGKYLIFSNNPQHVTLYLGNADIKNAVTEIFNDGFTSITANKKGITIRKPDYDPNSDLSPESMTKALQKISMVVRGL
ncbi:MAG: hypothetical protein PHV55_08765 [Candidatus Omnitrophica bacterium]|nr:hypothetical protein [Candidatus Omnitrophota bacterium]